MHISAIICEYNPIHNGHVYQINKTKSLGATHIISIMSSNFVQRGEPAIFSKQARTEMALSCGVDLVLELPCVWSMSAAERFAFSGVYIANALNVVNSLSFGCEDDNINMLKKLAETISLDSTKDLIKHIMKSGVSFANAREKAVKNILGEDYSSLISKPNNILAIEYIKALNLLNSNISPIAIKREGSSHDSISGNASFPSAMQIRNLIYQKNYNFDKFLPYEVLKIIEREISLSHSPSSIYNLERAILAKFRTLSKTNIQNINDVTEGLENRIYNSALSATSLEELFENIKSKRYTMSRIRRIILSGLLGIEKNIVSLAPQYVRVLGFNSKGLEILKVAKGKSGIPIITKHSDILNLSCNAKSIFESERHATDLYNLSLPKIQPCSYESTQSIIKKL